MNNAMIENKTESHATFILYVATIIGFVIGLWHLYLAQKAIFLFKEGEHWTSWAYMLCGPLSTLPAMVISLFKRKFAGIWLILGSIVSTFIFIVGEKGATEYLFSMAVMFALPMLILGIIMFAFALWKEKTVGILRNYQNPTNQ